MSQFDRVVSTEAFHAFTSSVLPYEGVSVDAFRASYRDLYDRREALRGLLPRVSEAVTFYSPMAHVGPAWYRRLTSETYVPPFRVPDSPDELIPYRTAMDWKRLERPVSSRTPHSTELVLSGGSWADRYRAARVWEDFCRFALNVPKRVFVAGTHGLPVLVHNDGLDRRAVKPTAKTRVDYWCPDLRGFAWSYDESPDRVEIGADGYFVAESAGSPWYVVSEADVTEIRHRARKFTFWRDTRRSYRIAENVWEDVAQDACIRFARILQDVWDWDVASTDEAGRPLSWWYDRFRAEDDVLGETSDDGGPAAAGAVPADETDSPDESGRSRFQVTRVTFYNWSVKAALIRYNLGVPDNQEEDGHWPQRVQPRPEQAMSANTWTSHANSHNDAIWDEVWQNGADYPYLRTAMQIQAERPKWTKQQVQAEVARRRLNPPKVTQKWRYAANGHAQDELGRLAADLDKRRMETRSVFILDDLG